MKGLAPLYQSLWDVLVTHNPVHFGPGLLDIGFFLEDVWDIDLLSL